MLQRQPGIWLLILDIWKNITRGAIVWVIKFDPENDRIQWAEYEIMELGFELIPVKIHQNWLRDKIRLQLAGCA